MTKLSKFKVFIDNKFNVAIIIRFAFSLYNTTEFGLNQTASSCRQQSNIDDMNLPRFHRVENIKGKKEELLVNSIFSFIHNIYTRVLSQGRSKLGLCGIDLP